MMAVMTFLGQPTPWAEIKKVISKPGFKDSLFTFDKENIPQSRLTKVQKFTRMESFNEGHMFAISRAAAALCVWVKAIEEYAQALKVVVPKREKKEAAEAKVKAMEEELAAMQRQFDEMQAELDTLQKNYDTIMKQLDEYQKEIAKLSLAIDRGEQLVSGLSGEKTRWTASQLMYEEISEKLVGDCLMAAGLISFMGPYPSSYRKEIT
jgi:dynein heavy chain